MILWALSGALLFLIAFCIFWTWNFRYWKKRGIPGPDPSILYGNTKSLVAEKTSVAYEFDKYYREYYGKAPFIGVYVLRSPHILAIDPDFVKFVLVENFKQFQNNPISDMSTLKSEPYIGQNPFMLKGAEWKDMRIQMSAAFTSGKMKTMFPIVENTCRKMSEFLRQEVANQHKDGVHFRDVSARFTTEVVSDATFGVEAGTFVKETTPLSALGAELLDCFENFINYFILTTIFPILTRLRCFWIVSKGVGKSFEDLMKKGMQFRSESNIVRNDFLSFIMDLGSKQNLSLTQMTSHALTVYLDSYETTSITISLVLYELARNEKAQEKLREEIKEYESKKTGLNYEAIHDMPYLDHCVNETMRVHAPIIIISKVCTESNVTYPVDGRNVVIPKGMTIHIPIFSIHRNGSVYQNPEKFIPERFENGGSKDFKDNCNFLPFGTGPRICLGMRFALLQVKSAVVEVIRQYRVTVNEKTKQPLKLDVGQFFSYPRHGIYLNLKHV